MDESNNHIIEDMDGAIQEFNWEDRSFLVVDDSEMNQFVTKKFLERKGAINIEFASDGYEAIKLCKKNDYDVVLMDVQMPKLDGLSATRMLRKDGISVYIIGLSANAAKSDIDVAKEAGMNEYLTKPLKSEDLERCISDFRCYKKEKKSA